ncbi:MAG: preprotein translocase subunit YajC [Saprospiraceae bacterium]
MLFPLLIIVVFYFFLIRPQVKKQKEVQKFPGRPQRRNGGLCNAGIIGRITLLKIDGPLFA